MLEIKRIILLKVLVHFRPGQNLCAEQPLPDHTIHTINQYDKFNPNRLEIISRHFKAPDNLKAQRYKNR